MIKITIKITIEKADDPPTYFEGYINGAKNVLDDVLSCPTAEETLKEARAIFDSLNELFK